MRIEIDGDVQKSNLTLGDETCGRVEFGEPSMHQDVFCERAGMDGLVSGSLIKRQRTTFRAIQVQGD